MDTEPPDFATMDPVAIAQWAQDHNMPRPLWEAFVAMRTTILRADEDDASDAGSDAGASDMGAADEELRALRKRGQEAVLSPSEHDRLETLLADKVKAKSNKRLRRAEEQINTHFHDILKQAATVAHPVPPPRG